MVCVISLAGVLGGTCAVILTVLLADAHWFVLALIYPVFGSMAALLAAIVVFHARIRGRSARSRPKLVKV